MYILKHFVVLIAVVQIIEIIEAYVKSEMNKRNSTH